jgi:7-carboxy-7-deazaguanine synthase
MIGTKTHFVRFGGCDYRCSWCDSMYAVDPAEVAKLPKMTEIEIMDALLNLPEAHWVTLSGGNPALFDLHEFVMMCHVAGFKVAVETQGTIWKEWLRKCEVVTVSPKPPSAGNITADYTVEKFMRQMETSTYNYRGRLVLKIVVFDDQDYEYAKDIFQLFPGYEKWLQVGNPVVEPLTDRMEQGYHVGMLISRLQWLSEKLMADETYGMQDARVTPQMHTLMWGNARAT